MALDHTKAIVSMRFTGLALFQTNQDDECEVGIVLCKNHRVSLDIQKETAQGTTLLRRKLGLNGDVRVDVNWPEARGVRTYPENKENPVFDRRLDESDPEDFRWVVDHEGSDFYDRPLGFKANQADPEKGTIRSRVFINHCILYTALRTDFKFVRVIAGDSSKDREAPFIGRIAFVIGADIFCLDREDSEVVVSGPDIGQEPLRLPREAGTKYWINIDNSCSPPVRIQDGTDFQLYYDVLDIGRSAKFDLRRALDNGGNPNSTENLSEPALSDISLDGRPDVCNGTTKGIGN